MPDRIHLLPDSVANQIAAGEVIQRPASVIKELVENAVDAGADDIRIYIKDAGRTLIQVIDNGHGMSETDTRMAFERHATSKISCAADLSSLRTMGFRGEALPSICAISMVEVRSRLKDSTLGTHLVIAGSRTELQEPDVCETGTNIMVKNLFFNVPARRKFLKSDNVELANIMREFERLALVNPGLRMSIDTGNKQISLRKGTMLQRIGEIWKGNIVEQLIPVEADTPSVKISGYVTRPEFARRRNPLQYFLVNGRNMRHPYFKKAILNCFNGLIAPDTMPCFFIKFDIDPAAIDVNIHPTKDEIKFEEEALIWSILTAAVKASIGKHAAVPSIDFESDHLPAETLTSKPTDTLPGYEIPLDYNPFATATKPSGPAQHAGQSQAPRQDHDWSSRQKADNWEKLYSDFLGNKNSAPRPSASQLSIHDTPGDTPATGMAVEGDILQLADKYLVAVIEGKGMGKGVVIADQYRAHMKILFERFMKTLTSNRSASQSLLFPEILAIDPEMETALEEAMPVMHDLGIVLEKEGDHYLITGVPPGVEARNAQEIVRSMVETVMEGDAEEAPGATDNPAETLRNRLVLTMARSMAVKRGRSLSADERRELMSDLFALPDPSVTPSGQRIFTILDEGAIERLL